MNTIPFKSDRVRAAIKGVLGTTAAVPLLLAALPVAAQEQSTIQELRNQVEALEDRLDSMEGGSDEDDGGESGIMFGDTRIEIGGYLKLDVAYDFEEDQGATLGPYDVISQLGSEQPDDGHVGFTTKQTRLTLTTTTPTAMGDIGGYIEMDMYGDDFSFDGNVEPRVRRAYITYGNWLFGRDWTTFSDFNYGTMLNFYGPQGQIFVRQAQIRYTFDLEENSSFEVALEAPDNTSMKGFDLDDGDNQIVVPGGADGSSQVAGNDPLPDLAARYKKTIGDFNFQVAGLARKLSADVGGEDESTFGWGLDVGGSYALPTGTTLMATASGGDGVGRYIYAPFGAPAAFVNDSGDLEAIERWGFIGTISQVLTPKLTTNFVYGYAISDAPEDVSYSTDAFHDNSSSLAVNLLYTPVDPLTFGVEFGRVSYETQDSTDADANRVQFSTIYNF